MDKKVWINILIGKEEEDILGRMDKKKLKKLEKIFKRNKSVLDKLGKKETTDKDIKDFIKLIEHNIIEKILKDLRKLPFEDLKPGMPNKFMFFKSYIEREQIEKLIDKYEKVKNEV